MIELYIVLIIFLTSVAIDLVGDYLWNRGLVKSVYVGGFHVDHELVYLSVPIYLVLRWLGVV